MDTASGAETEMNYEDTHKLKHTKIVVWVEEALQDLLVVSFVYGSASFQGVLLHSSRKKWPYGVIAPSLSSYPPSDKQPDEMTIAQQPAEADDDKLFAVSRRFTYLEDQPTNFKLNCASLLPRRTNNRRFDRNARTMRLRPRQVLCSKCKSICNENSENVEVVNASRRETELERGGGCALQRSTRRTDNLPPVARAGNDQSCDNNKVTVNCRKRTLDAALPQVLNEVKRPKDDKQPAAHKTTEEKQASVKNPTSKEVPPMAKTTPFIKISFGPQGTIVKIPPRTRTYTASDTDASTGEGGATPPQVQLSAGLSPSHSSVAAKAAKKALKKAKKEARRKMSMPNSSPLAHLEIQKQRHHKHKFKHKRKHKENSELAGEEGEMVLVNGEMENWDCNNVVQMNRCSGENNNESEYSDLIKKECLKQKLSISLKRLSEKSYTKCSSSNSQSGNSSNSEDSNSSNKSSTTTSNSEVEEVPEFPENEMSEREIRPLMMRIISHGVNRCTLEDGRAMSVGDIVWGKIHGFPWWPGKVLSITVSQRDNGILISQQAHVAWFGSSTSSCMPCRHLVPFLEDFQSRYNKKKRGPYKEAIKQAIRAAHQVQTNSAICDLSVQTVM